MFDYFINMIHFALVQLSKKHTEIFGTFIEIILYYNWELTIYYDKDNDPYTFLNYYNKLFNINLNILPTSELILNKNNHDYFIFTSSADNSQIDSYFTQSSMASRCIYVNHQAPHCQSYMIKNIQMSPVIKLKDFENKIMTCIVPFYRSYKKIHSTSLKTNLAIIGAIRPHEKDKNLSLLTNLLDKCKTGGYNIFIFMRKMDWKVISNKNKFLKNNPNIKFFPGLSTEKMIEKLIIEV